MELTLQDYNPDLVINKHQDFKFYFPSTIRKGFPVVVTAWIGQPDPTVGILNHYVNDMDIRTERLNNVPTHNLAEADWIRLSAEALTAFNKLMREEDLND